MEQTRSNIDIHDWDARASEALANAKKLPQFRERDAGFTSASRLLSSVALMGYERRFGVKSLIPLRAVRHGKSEISERFARSVNGISGPG